VYNGKKAQRFSGENIEESVATDFWTVNNTSLQIQLHSIKFQWPQPII
jgi:hypothetical protein